MATIIFRGIALAILMVACAPAQAASYTVDGRRLILSGGVYNDHEFAQFTRMLRDNPEVDTVLLRDFGGGMITAGSFMTIPQTIRERKLTTEIDGPCVDMCALAFLAGVKRGIAAGADPKKILVAFHGIYTNHQPTKEFRPSYVNAVSRYSGGRMPRDLIEKAYDLPPRGFLVFLDPRQVKGTTAWMCPDMDDLKRCKGVPGIDAVKAGVFSR